MNPGTARLFAFVAVKSATGEALVHRKGDLAGSLERFESFCAGADHIVGHNILRHDLPHLLANRPALAGLGESAIDTLWLNPLAFPRTPYHHLVKHYHDGRLQAGHVNDPEMDARLVFDVLRNQLKAFQRLGQEQLNTLAAYHFLTTRAEGAGGFDAVFSTLRSASVPSAAEAETAIRSLLAKRA